jgi:hypothetical protein
MVEIIGSAEGRVVVAKKKTVHRPVSKRELLAAYARVKEAKHYSKNSPFTGMATLCNWVMWHNERWYPKKMADYNQRVAEYDRRIDDGEVTLDELKDRLMKKAGLPIEAIAYGYDRIKVSKQNKFLYEMEKQMVDADNDINETSVRYILIHYGVLMDMGYGKMRLNRNSDWLNEWLMRVTEPGEHGDRIMDLHRRLVKEAGIYIEMPR